MKSDSYSHNCARWFHGSAGNENGTKKKFHWSYFFILGILGRRSRSLNSSIHVSISPLAHANVSEASQVMNTAAELLTVTDEKRATGALKTRRSPCILYRTSEIKFWNNSSVVFCEEGSPPVAAILPLVYVWRQGVTWPERTCRYSRVVANSGFSLCTRWIKQTIEFYITNYRFVLK